MKTKNNDTWIWEHKSFPDFIYKDFDLSKIYYKLGELRTLEKFLSKETKDNLATNNLFQEIVSSYLLDGEDLDKKYLENDTLLVKTFINSKNNLKDLNKATLYQWSNGLYNQELGLKENSYRIKDEEIEIISVMREKEQVHYKAPPGEEVDELMKNFLSWINKEDNKNPLYKIIIAPLYFLLIQAFNEDNEKISRLIFSNLLEKTDTLNSSFYEINSKLYERSVEFNKIIDDICISSTLDISKYIEFYLALIDDLLNENLLKLDKICLQNSFWQENLEKDLNIRQKRLITHYLKEENKEIKVMSYMEIENISRLMANRDLQDLVKKGILLNFGKGRGSYYKLLLETK